MIDSILTTLRYLRVQREVTLTKIAEVEKWLEEDK